MGIYTGSYKGIVFFLKICSNLKGTSSDQLSSELDIKAPLPGTIISLNCKPGDIVSAGTPLLSIESMKTEHKLCPIEECLIEDISVVLGALVQKGEILIKCKPTKEEKWKKGI